MTEPPFTQVTAEPPGSRKESFFLRKLPYIAVLLLTLFGVAYTSMAQQPIVGFWETLAVAVGVLCVITAWSRVPDKQGRFQLIWKQAVHWAAILVAMNIVLLPGVQRMLTAPATGLTILLLLALGTFLAGVNTSLQIIFLGFAMALAVPAIVWLKQSLLFLFLAAAAVIGIGLAIWRR
ncbi:MAG: hypothetical protein L0Y50_00800 [Beijerinckiaceae bacterium]|nr:hypothetical protein [Beijerinckiaceae bacterium]MCI0734812.1 hypothetical protein [Beijerinckiaceae bacterium]